MYYSIIFVYSLTTGLCDEADLYQGHIIKPPALFVCFSLQRCAFIAALTGSSDNTSSFVKTYRVEPVRDLMLWLHSTADTHSQAVILATLYKPPPGVQTVRCDVKSTWASPHVTKQTSIWTLTI